MVTSKHPPPFEPCVCEHEEADHAFENGHWVCNRCGAAEVRERLSVQAARIRLVVRSMSGPLDLAIDRLLFEQLEAAVRDDAAPVLACATCGHRDTLHMVDNAGTPLCLSRDCMGDRGEHLFVGRDDAALRNPQEAE